MSPLIQVGRGGIISLFSLFTVTGIWEESLEEKVFVVVESGCPLSIGADMDFPIELSFWFSDLYCL